MSPLFLEQWISETVVQAIGWTLVHSLWQGLLAAVLAGIIIISTRKAKARLRYNLLGAVLCLFIITVIISFCQLVKTDTAKGTDLTASIVEGSAETVIRVSETHTIAAATTIDRLADYFDRNAGTCVMIWAIFFLIHCMKLMTGLVGVQRIRNTRAYEPPAEWISNFKQLCKVAGVKQTVGLLESGLVKVPVAIGIFKPVILIPLGLFAHLPPEQVETILMHELAHIRRKDYIINIIQRFAEAVFFFNPAMLWVSSLIRREREACCDDVVMAYTPHKGSYLEALVSFQEYSLAGRGYVMAIATKRQFLLNRVKRMITRENQKLNAMEKLFLSAGVIAITAFTFIPQNEPTAKLTPVTLQSPVTEQKVITPFKTAVVEPPVRREHKKLVYAKPSKLIPQDTVPSKKEKTPQEELRFPSISSTINDDGKTKTETVRVTDQNGRTYSYTRVNDKLTSLSVDGKAVPEKEFNTYAVLLDQIDQSMQERKVMRLKQLEQRKVATAGRQEELKRRTIERKLQNQNQMLLKKQLRLQNIELKEKIREADRQKRETRRLIQKLNEKKQLVPMINGREVSVHNNLNSQRVQNSMAANISNVNVSGNQNLAHGVQTSNNFDVKIAVGTKTDNRHSIIHQSGIQKPAIKTRQNSNCQHQATTDCQQNKVTPAKTLRTKIIAPAGLQHKIGPAKSRVVS